MRQGSCFVFVHIVSQHSQYYHTKLSLFYPLCCMMPPLSYVKLLHIPISMLELCHVLLVIYLFLHLYYTVFVTLTLQHILKSAKAISVLFVCVCPNLFSSLQIFILLYAYKISFEWQPKYQVRDAPNRLLLPSCPQDPREVKVRLIGPNLTYCISFLLSPSVRVKFNVPVGNYIHYHYFTLCQFQMWYVLQFCQYFLFNFFFNLVAPGLSCGRQAPQLWHMGSLVVACELLVAACMWDLVP